MGPSQWPKYKGSSSSSLSLRCVWDKEEVLFGSFAQVYINHTKPKTCTSMKIKMTKCVTYAMFKHAYLSDF